MKIAIDISPTDKKSKSAHKVRGIGRYISLLVENIQKYDMENEYIFTSNPQNLKSIDLIHYPYFDPFFITLPIFNKFSTVVTVHDLIPIMHPKEFPVGFKGGIKWKINRMLLRKVDGIITDSIASKNVVIEKIGFDKEKIYPVYLAVEERFKKLQLTNNEKKTMQSKYNLPDKFFLYVGDVTWNKNLPRLISAIKEVDVPLVMVGKALTEDFDNINPWNRDRVIIEKETSGSNLFIKTGYVPDEDLVKIYNMAISLVMPSLDEGFGLPILEAMKSGCPVLTSNEGSLPEVGGDAVEYIYAKKMENIKGGLEVMLNKAARDELIEKRINQASKFSIEKFIKDTIASYKKIHG